DVDPREQLEPARLLGERRRQPLARRERRGERFFGLLPVLLRLERPSLVVAAEDDRDERERRPRVEREGLLEVVDRRLVLMAQSVRVRELDSRLVAVRILVERPLELADRGPRVPRSERRLAAGERVARSAARREREQDRKPEGDDP